MIRTLIPQSNVVHIGGGLHSGHYHHNHMRGGYVPLLLSEGLGASSDLAARTAETEATAPPILGARMGRGRGKKAKKFSLRI